MHVIDSFLESLKVIDHKLKVIIKSCLFEHLLLSKTIELLLISLDFDHSLKLANVEFTS